MDVRRATEADLSEICRIQRSAPEAAQWSPSGYELSVAEHQARIIGFLAWRATAPDEAEILNLAVDPMFRRHGVASALLRSLFRASPAGSWFLEVRESNQSARALYRKWKFEEVGVRFAYYCDPPETGIVMRRQSAQKKRAVSDSTFPRQAWPELNWEQWKETADTLHMYMQVIGKTRVALTPVQNHWWNVPFYLTARGLSTSPMPLPAGGLLDIEFDFIAHELIFRSSSGDIGKIALRPQSVAAFYAEYLAAMNGLDIHLHLDLMPVEVKEPIRFDRDTIHNTYDADSVSRFWRILAAADTLLKRFSTNFYGKISPVHFFWGSMDLAVTRFNDKRAPARPGADAIQAEAYSHECISAGFWPGNGGYGQAAFYCYAAPVPDGLSDAVISGHGAFNKELGEFVLNYDEARQTANPGQTILNFLANAYSAAADSAKWDRANLDRHDAVAEAAVHLTSL